MFIVTGVMMMYVRVLWETRIPAACFAVVWVIFMVLYCWKAEFAYPIAGRMVFLVGEIFMIGAFIVFIAKS